MSEPIISARASELFRLEMCPGSYRMQKGLPDEETELSKKGSLLHWHDAHPELDRAFLRPADKDLLEKAKSLDDLVIQRVTDQFELRDKTFTEARETFGQYSVDGFEITGHPDRIRFYESLTVIFEKKFGFLDQSPAELNKQLRAYSLIFAKDESVVSLLQPRKPFDEQVTLAHYTKADIESSRQEVASIIHAAADPNAPLNATEEGCRYCRAKLICSAFKEKMMVPAVLSPDRALSKAAREAYLEAKLAECSDEQLEQVYLAERLGNMIRDPLGDEIRKRKAAGGMTNFEIAKDSEVREVVNVRRTMALLAIANVDRQDMYDCVTEFSIGRLEEILRKRHPGWTWKQARQWTNFKLSSVIEKVTRKGRIIRK